VVLAEQAGQLLCILERRVLAVLVQLVLNLGLLLADKLVLLISPWVQETAELEALSASKQGWVNQALVELWVWLAVLVLPAQAVELRFAPAIPAR
jgi:hypothetical protein